MKKVTVTQLVDFAKCEKLGVLKLTRQEEVGAHRRDAMGRGVKEHARLERAASVDGRCFVASFAFGPDAPQTRELRVFRDERLALTLGGRLFIRVYYALSPLAVFALSKTPGGRAVATALASRALAWARRIGGSKAQP